MFAIRQMRDRAGLRQQEVADALGVRFATYGSWEREERQINLRDAIRLAELFGCTLDELAGRSLRDDPMLDEVIDAYMEVGVDGKTFIHNAAVMTRMAHSKGSGHSSARAS